MQRGGERKNVSSAFLILSSGIAAIFGAFSHYQSLRERWFASPAYAETENERNDGGNGSNSNQTTTNSTSTVSAPIYKTVLVTKVITMLDPQFTTDQDGDKIVDGLDPHPSVPESEYFTDDDSDGITNAFDRHPNEDDFAYYEEENDANSNGILDSYESMASR